MEEGHATVQQEPPKSLPPSAELHCRGFEWLCLVMSAFTCVKLVESGAAVQRRPTRSLLPTL
eukprot:scaffold119062_cov17-Tisochrysis_lutea.AAC.4